MLFFKLYYHCIKLFYVALFTLQSFASELDKESEPLTLQKEIALTNYETQPHPLKLYTEGSSVWIIKPDKIPEFNIIAQQKLSEKLLKFNIHTKFDQNLQTITQTLSFSQSLAPLLQGKYIDVYFIKPSLEEIHIGLVASNILTLKGEAFQEFRKTFQSVVRTFQTLGYGDYLTFCDFGKMYRLASGEIIKGHCWEMIPLGKNYVVDKNGEYELAPKICRWFYILFNQKLEPKNSNSSLISEFTKLLQLHLVHEDDTINFCKETLPWELNITDLNRAKEITIQGILSSLKSMDAVAVFPDSGTHQSSLEDIKEEEKKQPESEFNIHPAIKRENCAFCREDVLRKQEMIRGKEAIVLYSHLPYTKNGHFMIIPSQHLESLHCLTDNQFEEILEQAQKVSFALKDIENLVWFCQNGPRAGQTVPHVHIHVLRRPHPVLFPLNVLNELDGTKIKTVEENEYKIVREWILTKFNEY